MSLQFRLVSILLATSTSFLTTTAARWWVEYTLSSGLPVNVVGELVRLTRGENSGIAFGLLSNSPLVPWLSIVALLLVGYYLLQSLQHSRLGGLILGLVIGGGLSNLIDRMDDGQVTDYIDVGLGAWRFATFNLPDSAVFLGMMLSIWFLAQTSPDKLQKTTIVLSSDDQNEVPIP